MYLIEILHQTTTLHGYSLRHSELYLIEILHQTTTEVLVTVTGWSCILSKFYIKPQLVSLCVKRFDRCILSKFYIKPQRLARQRHPQAVVSYRNSTSNHNLLARVRELLEVVSYRNSTSNHNIWLGKGTHKRLYLIEILHQTTTRGRRELPHHGLYLIEILHQTTTFVYTARNRFLLYLIEILHQTTTSVRNRACSNSCILSKFYIKPQLVPLY